MRVRRISERSRSSLASTGCVITCCRRSIPARDEGEGGPRLTGTLQRCRNTRHVSAEIQVEAEGFPAGRSERAAPEGRGARGRPGEVAAGVVGGAEYLEVRRADAELRHGPEPDREIMGGHVVEHSAAEDQVEVVRQTQLAKVAETAQSE